MLAACVAHPDGTTQTYDSLPPECRTWLADGATIWIDLPAPGEEELRGVGEAFGLHADALEDCLHGEQRPRIDEFEDYIFLVWYGMVGHEGGEGMAPGKLAIFCGDRLLITVHREPLDVLATLRERCRRHGQQVLGRGIGFLLYTIIDRLVDQCILVVDRYEDRLDELEDISVHPEATEAILADLLDLRRELLELRRMAASEQELLMPLVRGEYEYVSDDLGERFRHVRDHLRFVVEQVDAQRELLNSVRDNYHATIAKRLNIVMTRLTTIATVLLPLSLVAAVYGMNVPLWPDSNHPLTFWLILGFMGMVAAGSMFFLRRQRWI